MKTSLALILMFAVAVVDVAAQVVSRSASAWTQYEFTFDTVDWSAQPTWDLDSTPCPPLSPGQAAAIARQFMSSVPTKDDWRWELSSINAAPFHLTQKQWIYRVVFTERPLKAWDGYVGKFEVVVLMDGTIPPWKTSDIRPAGVLEDEPK